MLVEDVMQRDVVTVTPRTTLPEALRLAKGRGVRHLPVLDGPDLVGIVAETDVLELFLKAMGAGDPSSRLDVVLAEGSGALADAVHAVEDAGVPISSIVTLPGRAGRREVVIRVRTINPGPAIKRLEARGYAVRNPWRG